jgi:dihydropteroate synthase
MTSPKSNLPGRFRWGERTYIMGILNVTPDSFSGDGLLAGDRGDHFQGREPNEVDLVEGAVWQGRLFLESGIDILDVGGESTRPGADPVTAKEEQARVIPVIEALTARLKAFVSIDTYKSSVADAALQAGAGMVNDVWGLRADPGLAEVVARHSVPIVLMHNRSSWANTEVKEGLGGRYIGMAYENLIEDIKRELLESVEIARQAGVRPENIILDPGIGFGKTVEQNLELVDRLYEIRALGYPVLLGPSRKSFIGYTLDLPPDQRLEGTAAAVAVGITRGADIIRVHDGEYMARVARMTDAIVRRGL